MTFFTLRGRPTIKTEYEGISECALPRLHQALFEAFTAEVGKASRVLDLASGRGAWLKRLADSGYEVTGTELNPENCQISQCRIVDLNLAFSDKVGAAKFDAATAIEMLEHIENPRHIFRECRKVMRQGGTLLLSTPNASGLHSRVKFLFTGRFAQFDDEQYNAIGHIRPLTYWELEKSLTEAGFAVSRVSFFNHFDSTPRTMGEVVKLLATTFLKPLVRGVAGGQCLIIVAKAI